MQSLADLFPKLPLCQACEALFTAPRLADGKPSIPEQIFQKRYHYKDGTDTEYHHYQRSREELEKSVMLGCELCSFVVKNDFNYSHWKHKTYDKVHCEYENSDKIDMFFDGGRPTCYPSTSEMVSFQIFYSHWIALNIWYKAEGEYGWTSSLTIFATEDDPASHWMCSVKPSESFVPLTSFDTAKKWFIECCTNHKNCHNLVIDEMPTRLIKLSPLGAPKAARLWSTAGKAVSYAALSYCWGGPQPFKTTTAASTEYAESLPYTSLPQTILDAFEVARYLDLQFIWIDSLCIIQDDEEDFQRELGKMAQVYQNAKLTISAASASHCCEGFLREDYASLNLFRQPIRVNETEFCTVFVSNSFKSTLPRSSWAAASSILQPINRRAWTLQEELLSSCLLIFTKVGIYWKCQSNFKPTVEVRKPGEDNGSVILWEDYSRIWGFTHQSRQDIHLASEREARNLWVFLIGNYTRRELSNVSDRLLAIAAAAQFFSARFKCDYLAGLWRDTLLEDLMWIVTSPRPKPEKYQGPSWSWASVNGEIDLFRFADMDELGYKPRIMKCSTILASEALKWGAVTSGTLVIKGHIIEVSLSADYVNLHFLGNPEEVKNVAGSIYWDIDREASTDCFYSSTWLLILCIKFHRSREAVRYDMRGLVLGNLFSDGNLYRRLAFFAGDWAESSLDCFKSHQCSEVTIAII